MSIGAIHPSENQIICRISPSYSNQTSQTKRLLADFPEEILLQITGDIFLSDDDSLTDFKNFQYTCKLFLRISQEVIQKAYWRPFFDFQYKEFDNTFSFVNKKIYAWFAARDYMQDVTPWARLDNLIKASGSKIFDLYNVWNVWKNVRYAPQSLSDFIRLGVLKNDDIKDLVLTEKKNKYITSESGFLSVLKETPDFHFFEKIPDSHFGIRNYDMLKKALKEDPVVFGYMVKSKICLYYLDSFLGVEPFIEAVLKPGEEEMMRALYPYIDPHACYLNGNNAAHAAARTGNVKALISLHEKEVDFKKKNDEGRSPIFLSALSASEQHIEFTKKLIEYGESASVLDNDKNTILMAAARESDSLLCHDLFCYLVKSGAKINAVNIYGENILHCLFENKKFEKFSRAVELIIKAKVTGIEEMINVLDKYGEGAFFINMVKLISTLLSQSELLATIKNKNNISPLELVKEEFGSNFALHMLMIVDKFNER